MRQHSLKHDLIITSLVLALAVGIGTLFGVKLQSIRSNRAEITNLYLAKANTLIAVDKFDDAAEALEKARSIDPGNLQVQSDQLKVAIFKIARESDPLDRILDLEKLDKAETDCRELLRVKQTAELTALLGIIYAHKDQPTRAIEAYAEANKMDPKYANALNYWGYTMIQWEFPGPDTWASQANDKLKQASNLEPKYPWPQINRAVILARNDDFKGAIDLLSRAKEIAADNQTLYVLWGTCLRLWGKQLQSTDRLAAYQKFSEALEKYRIAEAIAPQVGFLHFNEAETLAALGNSAAAVNEYQKAIDLDPQDVDAHANLAKLLLERFGSSPNNMQRVLANFNAAIDITTKTIEQLSDRKKRTQDIHAKKILNEWIMVRESDRKGFEESVDQISNKSQGHSK